VYFIFAGSDRQTNRPDKFIVLEEIKMMRLKDHIQVQTGVGQPVIAGDTIVTPQFQALIVRLPIGGFVWNRPTAVLVEQGGQIKRLPIRDITRITQLSLLGFGLVLSIVSLIKFSKRKESGHDRRQK
jgi:hypothetical protein